MIPEEKFNEFIVSMRESKSYITLCELKHNHSYQIYARNAYVGIWLAEENGFLISRYKMSPEPFLFVETHWDIDDNGLLGTSKPLKLIEECPFDTSHLDIYAQNERNSQLLEYLDNLEETNPVIEGYNSIKNRRVTAIRYVEKQKQLREFKAELDAQGITIDEYNREQRKRREELHKQDEKVQEKQAKTKQAQGDI